MYLIIHHIFNLSCTQSQSQSQFHDPSITIYHTNLLNIIQNTNKLYKNVSQNMESKTSQTISHNHKLKNTKTPRALNFINQFALGSQIGPSNITISGL